MEGADAVELAMSAADIRTIESLVKALKAAAWKEFTATLLLIADCKYTRFMASSNYVCVPAARPEGIQHMVVEKKTGTLLYRIKHELFATRLKVDPQAYLKLWHALGLRRTKDRIPKPSLNLRVPTHAPDVWSAQMKCYKRMIFEWWKSRKVDSPAKAYAELMATRLPTLRPVFTNATQELMPPLNHMRTCEMDQTKINRLCASALFTGLVWNPAEVIAVLSSAGYLRWKPTKVTLTQTLGSTNNSIFDYPTGSTLTPQQALYFVKNKVLLCRLLYEEYTTLTNIKL